MYIRYDAGVKPGGVMFLQMPDYLSTFEGHYRLPWLPLLPRPLAIFYLKLMRRTNKGLTNINYVTNGNIKRLLYKNPDVERIINQNRLKFIRKVGKHARITRPFWQNVLYVIWKIRIHVSALFRRKFSIDLCVVKKS